MVCAEAAFCAVWGKARFRDTYTIISPTCHLNLFATPLLRLCSQQLFCLAQVLRSLHQNHALASFARLCPGRVAPRTQFHLVDVIHLSQDFFAYWIAAEAPELEIDGTNLTPDQLLHAVRSASEAQLQNVTSLCILHSTVAYSVLDTHMLSSLSSTVLRAPCLAKLALHNVPCTREYFHSLGYVLLSLCRSVKQLKLDMLPVAAQCELQFAEKLLLFKAIGLVKNLEVLDLPQWSTIGGTSAKACSEPFCCLSHLKKILVKDASSEIAESSSRFPEWFKFQTSVDEVRVGPTSESSVEGYAWPI